MFSFCLFVVELRFFFSVEERYPVAAGSDDEFVDVDVDLDS